MQYNYVECYLPSNGKFYPKKVVRLRPKTIFDIKSLLGNPVFYLKSEIDSLQNCIDPNDNINVYNLVKQDLVYLLYKLRSLSDDIIVINYKNKKYSYNISELEIKYLENDVDTDVILPESNLKVSLNIVTVGDIFNSGEKVEEFKNKYPDYKGNVENTVNILSSISAINNFTDSDHIRNILEGLSWKDSIYLINEIEKFQQMDNFGVKEEIKLIDEDGKEIVLPIEITENFFRPTL